MKTDMKQCPNCNTCIKHLRWENERLKKENKDFSNLIINLCEELMKHPTLSTIELKNHIHSSATYIQKYPAKFSRFRSSIIKHLRRREKMTQVQLANKLGIPQSTLSLLEQGKRDVSPMIIEKLEEIFDVDAYKFLSR